MLEREALKVITLPPPSAIRLTALPILALVIPAHRFSLRWLHALHEQYSLLCLAHQLPIAWKPVVVLDGLSKADAQLCYDYLEPLQWQVVHLQENLGKGASVRAGFRQVVADYYLFTDDDFPYNAESIAAVVHELLQGSDVVFGRRNARYRRKLPFRRRLLSSALLFFNKRFLRLRHPDTQCGLKGFSEQGKALLLRTSNNGFAFDLELALLARDRIDLRWTAVEVEERGELDFSDMPVRTLSVEWKNLRELLKKSSVKGPKARF